ncbi:unnamed protein product, partial [Phaeothamnion confervicola]
MLNSTINVAAGVVMHAEGLPGAVIAGHGDHRLFDVAGMLHLRNLQIIGGHASNGGAVWVQGTGVASFLSCDFIDNTATGSYPDGRGGGIYNQGTVTTMERCLFIGNHAMHGGAIYNAGEITNIQTCDFISNNASQGGAIYNFGVMGIISASNFTDNYSVRKAGAIFNSGYLRGAIKTSFLGNNASYYGGAIANVLNGTLFSLECCNFTHNTAPYGGAIGGTPSASLFHLKLCNFNGNDAKFGGAIVIWRGYLFDIDECNFVGNSAHGHFGCGGAIYIMGSFRSMSGSTCVATPAKGGGGGVYFRSGSFAGVSRSTFLSNSAKKGGAISLGPELLSSIERSNFADNVASEGGGAIYTQGALGPVLYTTFLRNSAGTAGGAISNAFSTVNLTVQNCDFQQNSAGTHGGAIDGPAAQYVTRDVRVTIYTPSSHLVDSSFVRNTAGQDGGAIRSLHIEASGGNCLFRSNNSTLGGAVHVAALLADNCSFTRNAAVNGGAVYLDSTLANLNVSSSNFTENIAGESGGGLFVLERGNFESCRTVSGLERCCAAGSWDSGLECPACPDGFECGEAGLLPETTPMDAGWWRGNVSVMEARSCLNAAACRGGHLAVNDYCTRGYKGPLCAVCAAGYTSGTAYACHECGQASASASGCILAIAVLVLAGVICYVVSDLHGTAINIRLTGKVKTLWTKAQAVPFGKLRAPIVVLQIVTQYVAITGAKYPPVYQNFLAVAGVMTMNLQLVVSLGCLISFDFYEYLLLVTIVPLLVLALLGASLAVAWTESTSESRWERAVGKHSLVFMVLTFLIYSTVSTAVFQTFACDDLRTVGAKQYLRVDYRIECYNKRHNSFMIYAAFMALIYPIGIPAIYACMMWRQRHSIAVDRMVPEATRLADPSIQTTRFLWQPYKREVFWWELAECVRRICLTGVLVFILPGTIAQQAEWACVLSMLSLVAVYYFSPHEDRFDAQVYGLGCVIIFCSMFLSVAIEAETADDTAQSKQAVAVLLVVLNVVMVAAAL